MSKYDEIFNGGRRQREAVSIPPFDKGLWIQHKKAERERAFSLIDEAAERMAADGDRLKIYLDLQSRFPRFSVGNILLLSIQKPNATRIAESKSWNEAGVYIKRGETGILLLGPGEAYQREDGRSGVYFHARRVFDVSQTTAEAGPAQTVNRDKRMLFRALVSNAPCEIVSEDRKDIPDQMIARYVPEKRAVYVAKGLDSPLLFSEIARELAHMHMDVGGCSREENEFAAACVSYIICRRSNVDVSSFTFRDLPPEFQALDAKGVREELGKIRSAAINIETDIDRFYENLPESVNRDDAR